MRFGGELIGSLTLFMGRSGRSYSEEDIEFAEELAALAAPLVANVRLLDKQRRSEAELKLSEERLRLATDAGNIGIWEWNISAGQVTWSERTYELYGLTPGQFGGHVEDFCRLIHPADRDSFWQKIEAAVKQDDAFSTEFRGILPNGDIKWFSTWAHVQRSPSQPATGMVGAVIDITARKRAEERLLLLDALGQASRDASSARAVMSITTRMLGEHMEAARCAYADLEPDNDQFTIRDDWTAHGMASSAGVYSLDLFGPRAAADMRAGRTLVINDVDSELQREDGAGMFSAIGIQAIICCPLVKEGKLVAMMAVHHDKQRRWTQDEIMLVEDIVERSWAHIERVRSTEIMQESEAHLNSLFEQTAAGICEVDLSGRILRTNERYCRLLRRERSEIIGQFMQTFTHPEDLPSNMALFKQAIENNQPFEIEKRYLLPDGDVVWVSNTVSCIRSAKAEGNSTILAISLDISTRRHAEDELRKVERRKDEFLAMLAHELRNPLAPINAAADLLFIANPDPQRMKATSGIIRRQVRHMTSLIDDLLDVSRVTRGLIKMDQVPLDAKTIVADAIEQVRPLIEEKRHHLAIDLAPEVAHVMGDHKRLVQVLANLLNNAAKYTAQGGNIGHQDGSAARGCGFVCIG